MTLLSKYITDNKIDINLFYDKSKVDGTNEFLFLKFIIKSAIYISSKTDITFNVYVVRPEHHNDYYYDDIIIIKGKKSAVTIKLSGEEINSNDNELEKMLLGRKKKFTITIYHTHIIINLL